MQLPEIGPLKNSDININHVFFEARETLIQIMVRKVSETVLGTSMKKALWPSI